MKRPLIGALMAVLVINCLLPRYGEASNDPPPVEIAQLQVSAGAGQASNEFVELMSSSHLPLSLDGWQLQYRSGSSVGDCSIGWSTKLTIAHGVIAPGGHYLLGSTGYLPAADAHFAPGLADSKGAVRIVDAEGNSVDSLAWGGATCGEGAPAPAPPGGQSLKRLSLGSWSGDNASDFELLNPSVPIAASADGTGVYPILQLSEIIPQTDSQSAATIELYNPNAFATDLSAYGLMTNDGSLVHLAPQVIEAGAYVDIPVNGSSFPLNPGGDAVTLVDPSGTILDRSDAWTTLGQGESWSLLDGGWEVSNRPTPAAPNLPSVDPPVAVSAPSPDILLPVEITELLPHPTAGGTQQKYIELHNSSLSDLHLHGYSLKSGPSWGNHVTLPDLTLPPDGYVSLTQTVAPLSLAVSGGRVGLFDPSGNLVGQAIVYPRAPIGASYAKFADGWHWTTYLTPGATNILVAPLVPAKMTKAKVAPAKKTPKSAVKKVKKPTTTKFKMSPGTVTSLPAATKTVPTVGLGWLLLGLAGLTMSYVIYEFRHDLHHLDLLCRRNLETWRASRQTVAGRGDSGASE